MKLLVLPADGIGPEIVAASETVLDAADRKFGLGIELTHEVVGFPSLEAHGITIRPEILEAAKTYDGIILGTQSHADYPKPEEGGVNISASFRVGLDLYANIRPARTREGLDLGKPGLDLVIMREATEGFYPARNCYQGGGEVMLSPDMAISTRTITRVSAVETPEAEACAVPPSPPDPLSERPPSPPIAVEFAVTRKFPPFSA